MALVQDTNHYFEAATLLVLHDQSTIFDRSFLNWMVEEYEETTE